MTEVAMSTRIPKKLEKELQEYMTAEHLEKSSAVRKLLFKSLYEWKEERAIKLLFEGKTTISKAAEIAGMDVWSFISKLQELKIPWVKDKVIENDIKAFS